MNLSTRIPNKKISGFDYLRAIACIFVVAFHSSPLSMNLILGKALHVFLFACAVPIFIIMSLFITEIKGFSYKYIINRSYKIGKIYFLWGWVIPLALYIIFKSYLTSFSEVDIFQVQYGLYGLIVNGLKFPLKVHGIYFLVFLVTLTWIYFLLRPHINSYPKAVIFVWIGIIVNIMLPFFPEHFKIIRESLIPFLIYLPLIKILSYDYQLGCNYLQRALVFFGGYVLSALGEGSLILAESNLPLFTFHYAPYARLSIVLLAMSLVYISLGVSQKISKTSQTLQLISNCSLGIYLIHGFVLDFINMQDFNLPLLLKFLTVFSVSILLTSLVKDIPYLKQILIL